MIKQNIVALATLGLLTISASAANTAGCIGCHGKDFEKAALGKSKVVKEMSKDDIVKALKGYKDGSYGGAMKAMMAGQVKKLSDKDIEEIATSIAGEETKSEDANETKAEDTNATKEATPAKEVNVAGCIGCHGKDFEKAALGKSKIVKDMTKDDIAKALKGYKDGSYGGAMKAMMAGQAKKLSDEDIKGIAEKFGK